MGGVGSQAAGDCCVEVKELRRAPGSSASRFRWRSGKVWRVAASGTKGTFLPRRPNASNPSLSPTFHGHSHLGTMRINGSSIARLASLRSCSTAETDAPFAYRCHVDRIIGFGAARRPSLRVATPVLTSYLGFRRGAKTKSTVKLKDLPQGALKAEPLADWVDDAPRYPTVLQGHKNNMQKFKNCVILTRVGGFYEVRFCRWEGLEITIR